MTPSFALAIPHTPWIPERVASRQRLLEALGIPPHIDAVVRSNPDERIDTVGTNADRVVAMRWFEDKEPNRVWAQKLWRWAASTNATHLLQAQDDCLVPDNFWRVLEAMVRAAPDRVIGLEANHPLCRDLARQGKRWVRTRAWVVGVMYVFPLSGPDSIHEFLKWCDQNPALVDTKNEDQLISIWLATTGRDAWHPIPTIVDHDLTIPSVYHNGHQDHRRPVITWHAYEAAELERDDFWAVPAEVPVMPAGVSPACWFCLEQAGRFTSPVTGCTICGICLAKVLETVLNKALQSQLLPEASS